LARINPEFTQPHRGGKSDRALAVDAGSTPSLVAKHKCAMLAANCGE
jgi:hypothetical protein